MTKANDEARLNRVQVLCEGRNARFTVARRRVLRLIFASRQPLKAYDILRCMGAAANKPPIVYRALDFLMEHGFVHKINSQSAYVGCSHPEKRHASCYLLICEGCGAVQECCSDKLWRALTGVARGRKFQTQRVCVEIHGRCTDCRA